MLFEPRWVSEVNELLRFSVLVASSGLSDAVIEANKLVYECDSCFHLEEVKEHGPDLVSACVVALKGPTGGLDGLGEEYLSKPEVRALLVVTGIDSEPKPPCGHQIILYGRSRARRPMLIPSRIVWQSTQTFPDKARLMYLAVQAALFAGAGLDFHRQVNKCPMDFCFDKLDVAKGLTTGEVCDDCKKLLTASGRRTACHLTPRQIVAVERVLDKVQDVVTDKKDVYGQFIKKVGKGGNVPPPHARLDAPILPNLERVAKVVKSYFDEYSSRKRIVVDGESFFLPLRHYNSHTPTIPGARAFSRRSNIATPAQYVGGGYFLTHAGFGVAIDPGHNFLSSAL